MATEQLKFETIEKVHGGQVAADFNRRLDEAVADCMRRPGIDKARTIILTVKLKPELDDDGTCSGCEPEFSISGKSPGYTTITEKMTPRKSRTGGMLVFDTDQMNLPFPDGDQ